MSFEDNREFFKNAMNNTSEKFVLETAHELQSQAQRNTAVGKVNGGKTKGSWDISDISRSDGVSVEVGSAEQNAIWEEYGTGDYAVNGDGRKGGWYIPVGEGKGHISMSVVQAYGMALRKGKNGQMFVYTHGKRPKRAFQKAMDNVEPKVERILKGILESELNK